MPSVNIIIEMLKKYHNIFTTKIHHLCFIIFWLFLIIVLGVNFNASTQEFIIYPIIFYYIYERYISQKINNKQSIIISISLTLFLLILFLPNTRKAIAGYHIEKSKKYDIKTNFEEVYYQISVASRWYPNHPEILYQKYLAAFEKGDIELSCKMLEKCIGEGYNDLDNMYNLARLYSQSGKADKEITVYKNIIKREPNHPEANYCLAMYYDQKMHDKIKAVYHLKIARDNLSIGNEWRNRCEEILKQLGAE